MFFTRCTAGILACSALIAPSLAQGKPFKDALPAKTLMFFSMPDLDTSIVEFRQTALAKMWRESEMQGFLKEALALVKVKFDEGMAQARELHKAGMMPMAPADILELRMHGLTWALTGFSVGAGQFGPEPKVGMLMHVDFGASAGAWRKLIEFGLDAMMEESRGKVERSVAKLDGDIELITITPPVTEMSLNMAFVGNGLIVGTLTDEVKAAIAAVQGQNTILSKDPDYVATAKHLDPTGAEMEMYIHVVGMVDVLMILLNTAEQEAPNWPEQLRVAGIDRALTALGARSIRTSGFTSKYEGGKSVTNSFALSPEAGRKGFLARGSKPVDFGFLRWVPKDVASVSASTLDIAGIYEGLVGAVKAYNPDMADGLLAQLAELEQQVGITLKDDLFGVFGDQMASWSMGVSSFMSAPEGAMLLKIKDQEKLLNTLKKAAEMSKGMIDFPARERKGIKTWRLEINPDMLPQQASTALSFLQPCFAFKNGYMILALSTGDVRRTFTRMDQKEDAASDIRSNKEFARYLTAIQQQNPSSFAWTDWKATFESVYSAAANALAFLVNDDSIPFDMTLLPEVETLSQHLFSAMSWSTTTNEGFKSTSISPLGPGLFAGGVILAGVAVAAPNVYSKGGIPGTTVRRKK